jgi:hypothetical protein
LSGTRARLASVLSFDGSIVETVTDQLELIECQREQTCVAPPLEDLGSHESERSLDPPTIDRDRREHLSQLFLVETAAQTQRADLVAMEARGEVTEDGMIFVSGNAFDDQLAACDTYRERRRLLEKRGKPARQTIDGRDEERVGAGIDGVLVHGHRQLDEQVGVVLGQCGVGGASDDRAHCMVHPLQAGAEFWREKCFPRREIAAKKTSRRD